MPSEIERISPIWYNISDHRVSNYDIIVDRGILLTRNINNSVKTQTRVYLSFLNIRFTAHNTCNVNVTIVAKTIHISSFRQDGCSWQNWSAYFFQGLQITTSYLVGFQLSRTLCSCELLKFVFVAFIYLYIAPL